MNQRETKIVETIRNSWFDRHDTITITGEEGLQRIIFQKKDSSLYKVVFTITGKHLLVEGDIGTALFEFYQGTTIKTLSEYSVYQFAGKYLFGDREKWILDTKKAEEEITQTVLEWLDAETVKELGADDYRTLMSIIDALNDWSDYKSFTQIGLPQVYLNTESDWFDGESISSLETCGRDLSHSIISYWVAIQMISEYLKQQEEDNEPESL